MLGPRLGRFGFLLFVSVVAALGAAAAPAATPAAADGALGRSAEAEPLALNDPQLIPVTRYAEAEIRKLCDFCSPELRDTYQSLSLIVRRAAIREATVLGGKMFYLRAALEAAVPFEGVSAVPEQLIIVFQGESGDYSGLSLENSPFVEGKGSRPPPDDEDSGFEHALPGDFQYETERRQPNAAPGAPVGSSSDSATTAARQSDVASRAEL